MPRPQSISAKLKLTSGNVLALAPERADGQWPSAAGDAPLLVELTAPAAGGRAKGDCGVVEASALGDSLLVQFAGAAEGAPPEG